MQFLYPVFLIAGLSLSIPLIIHLFNLRRYKTVFFPHTRFLKNIQLHSRKQSELRYKWLLAARLLFLAFLVLAFAQPYWSARKTGGRGKGVTAIYIDNSQSMSLQNGQRSLLDIAKENAQHLVQSANGKFLVLTNDKALSYKALSRQQALDAIRSIQLTANLRNNSQLLTSLQTLLQDEGADTCELYYLSDFQKNNFPSAPEQHLLQHIAFNGIRIGQSEPANLYIDTAFFEQPALQAGQSNKLIVRTRYSGKKPESNAVLQLSIDGTVKSAASPRFGEQKETYDTLAFQVNDNRWQQILLTINDAQVHFDDSFFIAARSSPELSVLLLNEGAPNPYLQAALRSYSGFKVTEQLATNAPQDISAFNLLLFSGVNVLTEQQSALIVKALQNGQHVALFPGEALRPESINPALASVGDLRFEGLDTAAQPVSAVQSENRLVKEMFEKVPENVQLPFTKRHYRIRAGISANQQTVFSFRNGDPFFAVYSLMNGQLYLCATPALPQYGNFQSSYFFVPFLYQMASTLRNSSIYAVTAGQPQALYIHQPYGGEQQLLHLRGQGVDAIPIQKAEGMGVQVFAGAVLQKAGFYGVGSKPGDSTMLGVNLNRRESDLETWSLRQLQQNWQGGSIRWQNADAENKALTATEQSAFPLWKLCAILALAMLILETGLLSKNLLQRTNTAV